MAEISFESLQIALEATRGTAVTPPTHLLNLEGSIKPTKTTYRPKESRGTLAKNYRSKIVRKGCEWQGSGDLDPNIAPVLYNMGIKAVTSPTTPGTLSKLWTFSRTLTADDVKSATAYWGDPGLTQILQSDFVTLDEITIKNDASGEGVATIDVKGKGGFPAKVAAPSAPASIVGDTLPGQMMQLWLDTASAIGTTAVTGRLISVEHTIPTGITYKYLAAGPSGALDFSRIGREQIAAKTKLVFELLDYAQYDLWAAGTTIKCRVRHNGAFIETVSTVDYYNYFEMDIYGPFDMLDWGSNQGSNRTIEMTIESEVDATAGVDFVCRVQNQRSSL